MSEKSAQEWLQQLSPEVYRVTRQCGTEPPFSGRYYHFDGVGAYLCVCCGHKLFESQHKYDSGSGWPSFWQEAGKGQIKRLEDVSHGMRRVEIRCGQCDAHLGHVFPDGPQPTGERYCVNSLSLTFEQATSENDK